MKNLNELSFLTQLQREEVGEQERLKESVNALKISLLKEENRSLLIQVRRGRTTSNRELHHLVRECLANTQYNTYVINIQAENYES